MVIYVSNSKYLLKIFSIYIYIKPTTSYTRQHCFQQHEATVLLKCCLLYGGIYSFDLSGNMLPEIGTCSIFWQHVACFLQQATLHWGTLLQQYCCLVLLAILLPSVWWHYLIIQPHLLLLLYKMATPLLYKMATPLGNLKVKAGVTSVSVMTS